MLYYKFAIFVSAYYTRDEKQRKKPLNMEDYLLTIFIDKKTFTDIQIYSCIEVFLINTEFASLIEYLLYS